MFMKRPLVSVFPDSWLELLCEEKRPPALPSHSLHPCVLSQIVIMMNKL